MAVINILQYLGRINPFKVDIQYMNIDHLSK